MPGSMDEGAGGGSQDEALEITNINVHTQNSEPTLSEDGAVAVWVNPSASNQVMLVFRRGSGDQVSVEMS